MVDSLVMHIKFKNLLYVCMLDTERIDKGGGETLLQNLLEIPVMYTTNFNSHYVVGGAASRIILLWRIYNTVGVVYSVDIKFGNLNIHSFSLADWQRNTKDTSTELTTKYKITIKCTICAVFRLRLVEWC